jgi:hypothetical protein
MPAGKLDSFTVRWHFYPLLRLADQLHPPSYQPALFAIVNIHHIPKKIPFPKTHPTPTPLLAAA